MANREFDVIVWGATGFTGQLVVEYLVQTYGVSGDLRWAIAGRNRSKLESVRQSCLSAAECDQLPILIADSNDTASLASLVRQTRVMCTTVGPYAKFGTPLVSACVDAGTHYCDLTGEVQWMARVIPEYQQAAEASGARIVHTCGFDSVPFDMGNWYVQQVMFERHGVYAQQVKGRVGRNRGSASGGTIASILNMMEEAKRDPSIRRQVANPYALYPAGIPAGKDGADQMGAVFDPDFSEWTSPFIMAAINTRVVRRSNALLGFPWGEGFRYDEATLSDSRYRATLASAAGVIGMLTLALGPTRKLAQRFLPKPGDGPSLEQREAGHYEVFFRGIDSSDRGRDTTVKVSGDLDPGYGSTSKMLGEAAVCLAKDELTVGGGFWTPASALAEHYLDRLTGKAGLQFEIVDTAAG
ncbi:MAG: saccharopine dehydrogenase NADP-binding domain-containing protein [Halioglobus sp.]|nr:saccharopine dehydrogenase NADP-binding domain-containing protein [Halioglobus sp.]